MESVSDVSSVRRDGALDDGDSYVAGEYAEVGPMTMATGAAGRMRKDPGEGADSSERLVWALEKCRMLERDKLALLEGAADSVTAMDAMKREVANYRASNVDLKKLVSQLCIKLKKSQNQEDILQRRCTKAEAEMSRMKVDYVKMQTEVKTVTAKASGQHATFLAMTREAEASKTQFQDAKKAFAERLQEQEAQTAAKVARLKGVIAKKDEEIAKMEEGANELRAKIESLEQNLEAHRQRIKTLKERAAQEQEGLQTRIKELETALVDNDRRAANAVSHAEKVEATFALKDQQVAEFAQLVEAWEGERNELHRVLRQFEAKDEEQSMTVLALRKKVHSLETELHEIQRQRNLEHMASVDLENKVKDVIRGASPDPARS